MKFAFRTDASSKIGSGHVTRCLTLAKILRELGNDCEFIIQKTENNFIEKIKKENFKVSLISKSFQKNFVKKNKNFNYFDNFNWKNDITETISILENNNFDYLIIDHYGIDKKWEKKIKNYVKKIMVIDDLANRSHDCDILLDQNFVKNFKTRYNKLLSKKCYKMLGPKYALLQKDYEDLRLNAHVRKDSVKRILVYFGDSDMNDLIIKTILAFKKLRRKEIKLDVVINSKNQNKFEILSITKKEKNIKIYSKLRSLAPLIHKADLSIGACGSTYLERCCLGLPSLVITVAENQKLIAKELSKKNLIYLLGHYDKIRKTNITNSLKIFVDKDNKSWSTACKNLTDGFGAKKVASILTLNHSTKLISRLANFEDEKLLLYWANDSLVRSNAFNSKIISKNNHKKWLHFRLKNLNLCKIFIIQTTLGLPIGQVRFEKLDNKWFINYSLADFARGKRLGSKLIKIAVKNFNKNKKLKLFAKVKKDNIPSCKVFEKNSFKKNVNKNCKLGFFTYQL